MYTLAVEVVSSIAFGKLGMSGVVEKRAFAFLSGGSNSGMESTSYWERREIDIVRKFGIVVINLRNFAARLRVLKTEILWPTERRFLKSFARESEGECRYPIRPLIPDLPPQHKLYRLTEAESTDCLAISTLNHSRVRSDSTAGIAATLRSFMQ